MTEAETTAAAPHRRDLRHRWGTALVAAAAGLFGTAVGAGATLGGQWFNAERTDARSQTEFVKSTQLDLYKRASTAISAIKEDTSGIFSVLVGPTDSTADLVHKVDILKDSCKKQNDEHTSTLQQIVDESPITAPDNIQKQLNAINKSYEQIRVSCDAFLQHYPNPDKQIFDDFSMHLVEMSAVIVKTSDDFVRDAKAALG